MNAVSFCSLLVIAAVSSIARAEVAVFDDRDLFFAAAGRNLTFESWMEYEPGTLLEGQTLHGVTYASGSSGNLVVGSGHGAGWVLGYSRENGRYASFSSEILSFTFDDPIEAFGISLSQGNQNRGNRFEGASTWKVEVLPLAQSWTSTAEYDLDDFSGESFLGLMGLSAGDQVLVSRIRSDAPIVWNIRDISWVSATAVPEPTTLPLFGLALGILAVTSAKRRAAPNLLTA